MNEEKKRLNKGGKAIVEFTGQISREFSNIKQEERHDRREY